jgi:hypothetical protein
MEHPVKTRSPALIAAAAAVGLATAAVVTVAAPASAAAINRPFPQHVIYQIGVLPSASATTGPR